jgi:hypothetical protein
MAIIYQGIEPVDPFDLGNISPWIAEGVPIVINDYWGDQSFFTLYIQGDATLNPYRVSYSFAPASNLVNLSFDQLCFIPEPEDWNLEIKIDDVWTDSGLILENYCQPYETPDFVTVNLDLTGLGSISGISFVDYVNDSPNVLNVGNIILTDDTIESGGESQAFTAQDGSSLIIEMGNSFADVALGVMPVIFGLIFVTLIVKGLYMRLVDYLSK